MINIVPYKSLGEANHGWLHARHHFSFASYYNPQRMGFGVLRVINDDIIAAGRGFDTHPHQNMEIITYVRSGAITHKDNQGNQGRTVAGDVQVMSAGTGIAHSEFNLETEDTTLYQIWIEPKVKGVKPRWAAETFPKGPINDQLPLLVAGDESAPLFIHQDTKIYAGQIPSGQSLTQSLSGPAYLLASMGTLMINGQALQQGDGAEVTQEKQLSIQAETDAELMIIEIPPF